MILKRIDFNDGHLWVNKTANLGYGEQFYYKDNNKNTGVYTNVYSNTVPDDSYCASGFGYCKKSKSYKIVAQTNLNFSTIPYFEIEEENSDDFSVMRMIGLNSDQCSDVCDYIDKKYKSKYTEQNMIEFGKYLIELPNVLLESKNFNEHLKCWSKSKYIIPDEIEIEMIGEKIITTNCVHCEADAVIEPDKQFFCHRCGNGFHKINLVPKTYIKDDKIFVLQKK